MGTAIGDLLTKNEASFDDFNGKIVAVDGNNILYQFLSSIRGVDGRPLTDANGRVTSHLNGLFFRTIKLLEAGIKPVFIFDGKPHTLKSDTLKQRRETRLDAKAKFEKALAEKDFETAKKFSQRSVSLTKDMINDAKEMLEAMGIPVVQALSEGEAQAAHMVSNGDCYASVSQDYDSLLFGCPLVIRNLTVSGKRKLPGKKVYVNVSPETINLEESVKKLGISREKLIWIGIMIGTDFNDKIPRVGPKTALKYVQEYDNLEDIFKKLEYEPEYNYKEIEDIFMNIEYTNDYKIEFREIEKGKLIDYLVEKHEFSLDRIKKSVDKLHNIMNEEQKQTGLNQWF